jgi:hypothetical protein
MLFGGKAGKIRSKSHLVDFFRAWQAGFPRGIMERLKGALAFALDLERAPE